MTDESTLLLIEAKLIYKITRESMWTIVPRAGAVGAAIERILHAGTLRNGSSKNVRNIVDECAPCIMEAGTHITAQTFGKTCLQCIVCRARSIGPNVDRFQIRIHAISEIGTPAILTGEARISIDSLK